MELENDTAVNVAALLRDPIGTTREYPVSLERFALDDDMSVIDLRGEVKLTRLPDEILATVRANGAVAMECWRCLEPYSQLVATIFEEEYRVAYDVRTGIGISGLDEDERFEINDAHELDFGEALRQELIIALPMRPVCGDNCPGPDSISRPANESEVSDNRFAALAGLLEDVNLN